MTKRALIAMSGGVDSSAAAALMTRAGYECVGVTMVLQPSETVVTDEKTDVADAGKVADTLGFEHHTLDLRLLFEQEVIRPFVNDYEAGLTPNPCIRCNRSLKFGLLLQKAQEWGCELLVTGHYARTTFDPERGRYLLKKAANPAKDQSYVLYNLTQSQLAMVRFPCGEYSKDEIRQKASSTGLEVANKKDSQDICFIPDGDYVGFMQRFTGKTYPSGSFLDAEGKVVGRHHGAVRYTLGQRKGLGLAMGAPVYVFAKDMAANSVSVGPEALLFSNTLTAGDCNWIGIDAPTPGLRVWAKTRYRQTEQPATITPLADGKVSVRFDAPQRAVTPGQAVVFYRGDEVLGGGTILSACNS